MKGVLLNEEHIRQKRRLELPRGFLRLPDKRTLEPIPGYDVRKVPGLNQYTKDRILDSKGWIYGPSTFLVTATIDAADLHGVLLHVSCSYPDHDPSWDEIKWIRNLFFPDDIDCMMVLPRKKDYVNLHAHCFHLWQCPDVWDMT